jgi:hypothetical protein
MGRNTANGMLKISKKHGISIMRPDLDPALTADKGLYFDSGHFKTEVGNRILEKLLPKNVAR